MKTIKVSTKDATKKKMIGKLLLFSFKSIPQLSDYFLVQFEYICFYTKKKNQNSNREWLMISRAYEEEAKADENMRAIINYF